MLKDILSKAVDAAQVVTDAVIAPTLASAQEASDARSRALIAAQTEIREAEIKLNALHDAGADTKVIAAAEAMLASANIAADRANRAYQAAQKRLASALASETSKERAAIQAKLDVALVIRLEAAEALDRAASAIKHEIDRINGQDKMVSAAISAGVAARENGVTFGNARTIAEMALSKVGAIKLVYLGDLTQHPSAADLIKRDNTALTIS